MAAHRRSRSAGLWAPVLALLVVFGVLVGAGLFVWHLITGRGVAFIPPAQQCIATVGDTTASLDLEQSHYASIIVAESIRRGLVPRAASIALATAMQESNIRNLDYGDRDSVGLFQQRPSQGWGTEKQLMDPWYASGKFYEALVQVKGWQSGDINDVAQAVQRSGVPDGYRQHIPDAKAFGSALTGDTPASLSCVNRGGAAGDPAALATFLRTSFPKATVKADGKTVTVTASSSQSLWAAAQLAMMNTGTDGVIAVEVGGKRWANSGNSVATWKAATPSPSATSATITVR